MNQTYSDINYETNKFGDFVAVITVSPQVMAEGDFNAVILKRDGSGFIEDSDGSYIEYKSDELADFIVNACSLSYDKILKNLNEEYNIKIGKKNMENIYNKAIKTLDKADKEDMLSPEQQEKLSNLKRGELNDGVSLNSIKNYFNKEIKNTEDMNNDIKNTTEISGLKVEIPASKSVKRNKPFR